MDMQCEHFILGFLGVISVQVVIYYRYCLKPGTNPKRYKNPKFYITILLLALVGGLLGMIAADLMVDANKRLVAFSIGTVAHLIIEKLPVKSSFFSPQ